MTSFRNKATEKTTGVFLALAARFGEAMFTRADMRQVCVDMDHAETACSFDADNIVKRLVYYSVMLRVARSRFVLSPVALGQIDDIRARGIDNRFRATTPPPPGHAPAVTADFIVLADNLAEGAVITSYSGLEALRKARRLKPSDGRRQISVKLMRLSVLGVLDRVAVGLYAVSDHGKRHLPALRAGATLPTAWEDPASRASTPPVPPSGGDDDDTGNEAALDADGDTARGPSDVPLDRALATPGVRIMRHGGGADFIDQQNPRSTLLRINSTEFENLRSSGRIAALGGQQTMFRASAGR